jgi:hypothetical protein
VRLTADGKSTTQPLVIRRNPWHEATEADLQAQLALGIQLRDKVSEANNAVIQIRDVKRQVGERLTKSQDAELRDIRARIADLERRWDTRTEEVHASGRAEGELANRLLGFDADLSQAALDTLPLWFWMFARVFAVPAAAVAIAAMRREGKSQEPRTAAKSSDHITLAARPLPAAQPRTALPEPGIPGYLTRKAGVSLQESTDDPTPPPPADAAPHVEPQPAPKPVAGPVLVTEHSQTSFGRGKPKKLSKSERYADIDAPTRAWLAEGHNGLMAVPVALSLGAQGPDIYDAYEAYCIAKKIKPLNESHFGRSMRRVGIASKKTGKGVTRALRLVKIPVRRAA